MVLFLVEHESNPRQALAKAGYLENHGDFVGAYRVIQEARMDDPANEELAKKGKELLSILCWRC